MPKDDEVTDYLLPADNHLGLGQPVSWTPFQNAAPAALKAGQKLDSDTVTPLVPEPAGTGTPLAPQMAKGDNSIMEGLKPIKQAEATARNKGFGVISHQLTEDQARVKKAFDAEGIEPGTLQPWNHEQQKEKFTTAPLKQFSSLGVVFAVVASAFTKKPMINALSGATAALGAIKEGDEKNYQQAFDSWKENTSLALKRQNIQHQQYEDAGKLMDTNMTAGNAQMRMLAAKFGDQQMLHFLNNGMNKEAFDLIEQRNKAATGTAEAAQKMTDVNMRQWAMESWLAENKAKGVTPSSEQIMTKYNQIFGSRAGQSLATTNAQTIETRTNEIMAEHPEMSPGQARVQATKEVSQAGGHGGAGGNQNLTRDRQIAAAVATKLDELRQTMPEGKAQEEAAKYGAKLKAESTPTPPGAADKLKSLSDRYKYANDTIRDIENLMKNNKMITGLGGRIMRPKEIIGEALGKKDGAPYKQFESKIAMLQEWAGRLLNESASRPLAQEESRIVAIVPGMSLGSTVEHTTAQMEELAKLFTTMQANVDRRINNSWTPTPAGEVSKDEKSASKTEQPWLNDPVKK